MDAATLRLVVIVLLVAGAALWLLSSLLFRVTGTWERVLTDDELRDGQRPERISLGQMGPFITGRRDVPGGHQEFSGMVIGPRVTLVRRDHGKRALVAMGFPDGVAQKLDGEVMARMKLTLRDGLVLEGSFEPQKVEFTHQPPKVTKTYWLPGQPRRYRRLQGAAERVPELQRDLEMSPD